MALDPPRLPLAVRLLNAVGGWLRAAGLPLVELAPEPLLERACRRTGLGEFGDPEFREGLTRLLTSYEREARLTLLGRIIARRDVLRLLEGRLRLVESWRRHPEILGGRIERPIFILGLPRTGTSILHEMLAQDPANRVPMTWEVFEPWPPPERDSHPDDPRIEAVERHLGGVDALLPDFKRMHPMGAQLAQECVAITAFEFASWIYPTAYRVPGYQAWLEQADARPAYRFHRRFLQYLQWKCPAERWVLKSPGHLWSLDALLDVYPDARLVHCHRDPLKVVASVVSLVTTLRSLASDQVDPLEIGAEWSKSLAEGLQHAIDVRERRELPAERVFDLRFPEFMSDELGMVRRLYAHFGLALSAEAEARMRGFLESNPREKHGAHRYALRDAGLDLDAERRRFAFYQRRFEVASES